MLTGDGHCGLCSYSFIAAPKCVGVYVCIYSICGQIVAFPLLLWFSKPPPWLRTCQRCPSEQEHILACFNGGMSEAFSVGALDELTSTGRVVVCRVHLLHHLSDPPPFPAPLADCLCPSSLDFDLHLPSLALGILVGFLAWPFLEGLLLLRTALLRAASRRLAGGIRLHYRLL